MIAPDAPLLPTRAESNLQQQIKWPGARRPQQWIRHWRWLAVACIACLPVSGWAQSLSYLRGDSYSNSEHESSLFYKIEYRAMIYDGFAAAFDYVNEGHFTGHHPDGYGLELSYQYRFPSDYRMYLVGGVGAFYYFDTITPAGGQSTDAHGLAPMATLSLRGQLWKWNKLDWVLSADSIDPTHDVKDQLLSLGLAYWLSDPSDPGMFDKPRDQSVWAPTYRSELSVYGVLSVINISGNPNAFGASAEYRYIISRSIEGTIAYIYEGDPRVARRSGVTLQLWPVRHDVSSGFEVGAGFGAYAFVDKKHQLIPGQTTTAAVAPVVSLMLSHAIYSHFFARAIWDRVVSNYSRDADIWRIGVGLTF
jgi:hypothetical protein